MPFPKKKKKTSDYEKSLSTAPIKGLSSQHISMKKAMPKKVKSLFGR